jgi:hypothetical protein
MTTQLIYYPELIRAVSKAVKNETPLSISDLEAQKNWLSLALPAIEAQKYVSISPQYDVPYRDFQIVFDLVFNTKYIYNLHFRVSFKGYHPYLLSEYSDTPISSLASVEHLIAAITAIAKHAETYLKNGQQVEAEEVKKDKISSLKYAAIEAKMLAIAQELDLPYAFVHGSEKTEMWFKIAKQSAVQIILDRATIEKDAPSEIVQNIVEMVKQAQFWSEKSYSFKTSVKTKIEGVNWKKPEKKDKMKE